MNNSPDNLKDDDIPFATEDKLLTFKNIMAQRDDMRKLQEADKKAIDKALAPHRLIQSLLVTLFISVIPLVLFKWQYLRGRAVDTTVFFIFVGLFAFISLANLKLVTPYIIVLFRNVIRGPSLIERLMWIFMALMSIAAITIVWLLPIVVLSGRSTPYIPPAF